MPATRLLHTDGVSIEQRGEQARRSFVRHAERSGGLVFICVVIWLVSGAGYFWPLWVILFVVLRLAVHARRTWGSSAFED